MGAPRIVGQEWADRYPDRFRARNLPRADGPRAGCPVCGNPTGDCAPHPEQEDTMAGTRQTAKKAAARRDPGTGVPVPPDDTAAAPDSGPQGPQGEASGAGGPSPAPAPAAPGPAPQAAGPSVDDPDAVIAAYFETAGPGPGRVVPRGELLVEFVPARAKRTSTVLAFARGVPVARASVHARLDRYAKLAQARIVYGD